MARKTITDTHQAPSADVEISGMNLNVTDAVLGARLRRILSGLGRDELVAFGVGEPVPSGVQEPIAEGVRFIGHVAPETRKGMMNLTVSAPVKAPRKGTVKMVRKFGVTRSHRYKLAKLVEVNELVPDVVPKDPLDTGGDALDQALSRARLRGHVNAANILSNPEMLSAKKLGDLIGISRQAIDKRHKSGLLLGLKGGTRSIKYPSWQVMDNGETIPGLADVLALEDIDAWTAYRLLVDVYPDGENQRVYEKLRDGQVDLVLAHMSAILDGSSST